MTSYTDLFDYGTHARRSDPDTSHEAAESIDISAQARIILNSYAVSNRPLLDYDAYYIAGFPPNARDGQRCSDLRHRKFIERTGDRAQTPSGKSGHLCRITQAGREYLASTKLRSQ